MSAQHTPGPWFVSHPGRMTLYIDSSIGGGMLQEVACVGPTEKPEQQAENARLIAAAPDLLKALQWREQFEPRDGEDSNDRFERVAETFHRETGYLAPGKDCRLHSIEDRQAAWDEWMKAGRMKTRAAIEKALGK